MAQIRIPFVAYFLSLPLPAKLDLSLMTWLVLMRIELEGLYGYTSLSSQVDMLCSSWLSSLRRSLTCRDATWRLLDSCEDQGIGISPFFTDRVIGDLTLNQPVCAKEFESEVVISTFLRKHVTVCLHWLPYDVTDQSVEHFFREYGDVQEVSFAVYKETGIITGVREVRLILSHQQYDRLPYTSAIGSFPILLTVSGRPPLCLRCNRHGHTRKECDTASCASCGSLRHSEGNCGSYASWLSATQSVNIDAPGTRPQLLTPHHLK